jgi:hypothetical protein
MIIKSMSRKEATFGQLLGYMNREAASERYSLRHNCYARGERELEAEFSRNAARLKARKNGVFLFHEVLSITKTGNLSDEERKDILRNIAQKYIQSRCPGNLAYGVVHDDHSHHLHYHLLISANEVESPKRTRLSRAEFQSIKVDIERRVLAEYPELEQKVAIEKEAGEGLSLRGGELKRRTGETPQRDALKERVLAVFEAAQTKEELFERLQSEKVELYTRGNTIGVIDLETGRKHRLKTIGLWPAFEALEPRFKQGLAKDQFGLPPPPEVIRQPVEKTVALIESLPHRLADAVRAVPGKVGEVAKEVAAEIRSAPEDKPSSKKVSAQKVGQAEPKEGLWERAKAIYSKVRAQIAEASGPETAAPPRSPPMSGQRTRPPKQDRKSATLEQDTSSRSRTPDHKSAQKPYDNAEARSRTPSRKLERRQETKKAVETDFERIARERTEALRKATKHLRNDRQRGNDEGEER